MADGCIDENTALAYVEGLLRPTSAQQIETHVATCAECRMLLAEAGEAALDEASIERPTQQRDNLALSEPDSTAPPHDSRIGDVLKATYVLRRFVGRGGMGTVYEARHLRLDRRFAVKVLCDNAATDPVAVKRLQREAQITSRLEHPHIVRVVDFDYGDDDAPFIVMELLEGESLARRIARAGAINDLQLTAIIARQTASALYAAHGHGVIHRDLKPSNLFLCRNMPVDPFVKVMDFGISKIFGTHTALTTDASVLGSPRYMSPEQALGRSGSADPRADIFALGVVIYQMLTGAVPFDGDSIPETLFQIVYAEPNSSPKWRAVPTPIRDAVLHALSKDPNDRPSSMAQFWGELAAGFRSVGVTEGLSDPTFSRDNQADAVVTQRLRHKPPKSRKRILSLLAMPLLVVFIAVGYFHKRGAPIAQPWPVAQPRTNNKTKKKETQKATQEAGQTVAHSSYSNVAFPKSQVPSTTEKRRRKTEIKRHRVVRYGAVSIQSKAVADGRYLWATVYLDGRRVGETALTLDKVRVGRHRIDVRRPGYRTISRRIVVRPNKRSRVTFELVPIGGSDAVSR